MKCKCGGSLTFFMTDYANALICSRCYKPRLEEESRDDRMGSVPVDGRARSPQLPDALGAPHSNETTSLSASAQIKVHLERLEVMVLEYIMQQGGRGATDQEIEVGTGLGGNTVRPRRRALVMKHLVADSGKVRITQSGRRAIVWVTN